MRDRAGHGRFRDKLGDAAAWSAGGCHAPFHLAVLKFLEAFNSNVAPLHALVFKLGVFLAVGNVHRDGNYDPGVSCHWMISFCKYGSRYVPRPRRTLAQRCRLDHCEDTGRDRRRECIIQRPDGLGGGYLLDESDLLDVRDEPVKRSYLCDVQQTIRRIANGLLLILCFVHAQLAPELVEGGILFSVFAHPTVPARAILGALGAVEGLDGVLLVGLALFPCQGRLEELTSCVDDDVLRRDLWMTSLDEIRV